MSTATPAERMMIMLLSRVEALERACDKLEAAVGKMDSVFNRLDERFKYLAALKSVLRMDRLQDGSRRVSVMDLLLVHDAPPPAGATTGGSGDPTMSTAGRVEIYARRSPS